MNRIGIGYDVHPFATGRVLVLGGVEIPGAVGLDGHSDADVLSHAIADALLGAAGKADIGHHFPNTDESIRGISSQEILRRTREILTADGWVIGNVDATMIAEKPKIAPYIDAMKSCLTASLGLTPDQIGIKATTNERMGFIGRGEGIAAMAVAILER
ncbi:MAG: 2-C-methyl-D-erythritol 2,4-cyclodiphosphate synthase [Chthoniobacterales bacterium]